jgi:hypothetical protein
MPHPERASEPALGSADGLAVFESALRWGRESFLQDTLDAAIAVPSMTVLKK